MEDEYLPLFAKENWVPQSGVLWVSGLLTGKYINGMPSGTRTSLKITSSSRKVLSQIPIKKNMKK